MRTALVTGGSGGLGLALVRALAADGWDVVTDARRPDVLAAATRGLGVRALPGDVTDPAHRADLVRAVGPRLDLLVNGASTLGPLPMPPLRRLDLDARRRVLEVDATAPLALVQALLPALRGGVVVDVSSDAAVEGYPGWGAYGAAEAALDRLSAVLAVEEPDLAVYALDPGDMRTAMQQAAFPAGRRGRRAPAGNRGAVVGGPRPAGLLRPRPGALAAAGLPDRLRRPVRGRGQRRAERRPAVQRPGARRPRPAGAGPTWCWAPTGRPGWSRAW